MHGADSAGYAGWDEFDTEEYVWRNYGKRVMDVDRALIHSTIEAMLDMGLRPGSLRRVADVGVGPNLFPALLLAPFVQSREQGGQCDLIELGAGNRRYLNGVLGPDHDTVPLADVWDKYEDLMADRSAIWRGALARVREVAVVQPGDVFALAPDTYDAISAYFVPESITDSRSECERAVARLLDATKPGGFVMVGHMLESSGWHAGEGVRYPAVPLTVDDLREMYQDRLDRLAIIEPPWTPEVRDGYRGAAVVVGTKVSGSRAAGSGDPERTFTSYDIQNCLFDRDRVEYFRRAIFETVRPGDVVVDGGSGTGVLGLLAARAGAARVYCVEINREYVQILRENARHNGLADQIVPIWANAATVDLPEPVDVVISEVISGGLFYEPQLDIVANLRRFLRPGGSIVPMEMNNYLELVTAQEELYGLTFRHDSRHRTLDDVPVTTRASYLPVDFYRETPRSVVSSVTVRAFTSGLANAVRVPYSLRFSPNVQANTATEFLLNPQVIFLPEPVPVVGGAYYTVSMAYEAGRSPLTCKIAVSEAA